MPGAGLLDTMNCSVSQWLVTTSTAFGRSPAWRFMSTSEASRRS
jgi:hypothetical protein